VATVCNRVLVFRDGLITAELRGTEITVARLLSTAAGAAAALSDSQPKHPDPEEVAA
jgi:ribose transport system ATP-binding protein